MSRRTEVAAFAALTLAAVVAALLVPTYPNYDSYFHLVWGRELLDGMAPGFEAYAAPTQHPLFVALSAVLDLLFGGAADRALVLVCVASFVALVWAVFRVGRACFGAWPGALGAVSVGSSFAFLLYAARGYVDMPFLACVLWAAALEAEKPRRGVPVAALLAVAGLLRPEAWVLAGLYWLWVSPRRADLLALTVVAPAVWALCDLLITGDPLFSLHATSTLAEDLGRERGIAHVPASFVSFLADTARLPVFAAGLLGGALAITRRGQVRALHVPLALFAAGTLTFVGTGVADLSILPRYLTVPVIALCLFAGYAVLALGRRVALVALVAGAAFLVIKAGSFATLARELRFIDRTHRDVAALAADPLLRRCPPLTTPTYRLVPDLRFELDGEGPTVASRARRGRAARGLRVFVTGEEKAIKRFGQADGVSRRTNVLGPRDRRPAARHGFLTVYARCGG